MKSKLGILSIVLLGIGYLFNQYVLIEYIDSFLIRCLVYSISIFIIGDLIGYYVLKLPFFNYSNIFTYIKNEIIGQFGFLFTFFVLWASLGIILDGKNASDLTMAIVSGPIIPTLYYTVMRFQYTDNPVSFKRKMKRKL